MKYDPELQYVEQITSLVSEIAGGNGQSVGKLLEMTAPGRTPQRIAKLAEAIGTIVVQNEARQYRLELMVKDLLASNLALDKARHDPLTGLPNRSMFHDILEKKCDQALESQGLLALLFIDLDKFKEVNDTLGHAAGDELLVLVSLRLRTIVGDQGVAARQGGDEFTVLLDDVEAVRNAEDVADRIVRRMREPFALTEKTVQIGSSVGLSFFPSEADSPLTLLKNADVAMYQSKQGGRNSWTRYQGNTN